MFSDQSTGNANTGNSNLGNQITGNPNLGNPNTSDSKDNSNNTSKSNVLAITDRVQDFIFAVNVPALVRNSLNVSGPATFADVEFTGNATISGLLDADEVTVETLQRILNIQGDVVGTDLTNVLIADGAVRAEALAETFNY